MNRRGFLASILAFGVAPWVCTTAGVLMPVKKILTSRFFDNAPQVIIRKLIPFASVLDVRLGEYSQSHFGYIDISVTLSEYEKRYRSNDWMLNK